MASPHAKTVYLSLGSNVGDRRASFERAMAEMNAHGIVVRRVSSFYETEPVDFLRQGWFLNCVVEAETFLLPLQLLHELRRIERRLGRRRMVRRGPRGIDIDILLYENAIVRSAELQVPHPRLTERRFVLQPLRELAPSLKHPTFHRTVAELLAETPDRSRVRRWRGNENRK
jgi:2-amino-4-hydroxy-6-hydroxymethyldihydropteridine diphosphokinase